MADDSRARLIAYLCQAGLSTARATAVLDDYVNGLAEQQRQFANKRRHDEVPPISYDRWLGMVDVADALDPKA